MLPLDDCLYGLQPPIPHLTRSSLHRCLKRHGMSRLPEIEGDKPKTKRFADYAIGYFHIDIAEVRLDEGRLYCSSPSTEPRSLPSRGWRRKPTVTSPRTSRAPLIEAVSYEIHTVLTDNGQQFCHAPRNRSGPTAATAGKCSIASAKSMASRIA